MADQPEGNFILGMDLGSNSLGWAMIGREDGNPSRLLRAGVRNAGWCANSLGALSVQDILPIAGKQKLG